MKTINTLILGLALIANIALATTPNRVVGNCWTDCNGNPANTASYSVHIDSNLVNKSDLLELLHKVGTVFELRWRYPYFFGKVEVDDPNAMIAIEGSLNKYTEDDINNGRSTREVVKTSVETKLNELLHNEAILITCLEGCWVTPPTPPTR